MIFVVEVVVEGSGRPPAGSRARIEVRDTSLADTEAPLVAETTADVLGELSTWLLTVELEIPAASIEPSARLTVFSHVDVDGDGTISSGDFITTQSYPVDRTAADEVRLSVTVVRI